jgi:hypothetical protein
LAWTNGASRNWLAAINSVRHFHVYISLISSLTLLMAVMPAVFDGSPAADNGEVQATRENDQTPDFHRSLVHLYFGDKTGRFLSSEERVMSDPGDAAQFATDIIRALIDGPRENLLRTLPSESRLRALFIADDACCFVDLNSASRQFHPGGCRNELLSVYSIVNSLVLNVDAIHTVKLLVDGEDVPTLAGHIDLQSPLAADMLLIR